MYKPVNYFWHCVEKLRSNLKFMSSTFDNDMLYMTLGRILDV
jgi:hypothetical protein